MPPDGAVDVPSNVRLFVSAQPEAVDASSIKLIAATGGLVPFHVEDSGAGAGQVWVVPDAPLTRGAYSLQSNAGSSTFATNEKVDETPPTSSSLRIVGASLSGACERHYGASLIGDVSDDSTPRESMLFRVDLEKPRRVLFVTFDQSIGRFASDEAAWQACVDNDPDANPSDTFHATITPFDLAGNPGAPTSNDFQFQSARGCGCSLAGAPSPSAGAGAALLLGAAVAYRTRRRAVTLRPWASSTRSRTR